MFSVIEKKERQYKIELNTQYCASTQSMENSCCYSSCHPVSVDFRKWLQTTKFAGGKVYGVDSTLTYK
ncbi:CLUMA_CG003878, isoform A [Clunio marinus]|uniref:CLUMA_CG003878, isoform A n=1 Tax=Clunio marinus TaxID=568069 RepID=A0A1J1HQA7_9DIPT|nr:CLUMA_CG003878, isoform A [Clunio marinus]